MRIFNIKFFSKITSLSDCRAENLASCIETYSNSSYANSTNIYLYNYFDAPDFTGQNSIGYEFMQLNVGHNRIMLDNPYLVRKNQLVWLNQNSTGKVALDTSGQSLLSDLYVDCDPFCYKLHKLDEQTNKRFYMRAIYKSLSEGSTLFRILFSKTLLDYKIYCICVHLK